MKAIQVKSPSILQLEETNIPTIESTQVLVKIYAAGINRADIAQKKGLYPPPVGESNILGLEVAGIIENIGDLVKGWTIGDRVCVLLAGGGYAQYVAVDYRLLIEIPGNLDFFTGAAIPEAFLTAHLKISLAQPKAGETILIHAGASGVGTAALQLSRLLYLKVIATTGTFEKTQRCLELGADFAIDYSTQNISQEVLRITEGKGADIILDFIGASYWKTNFSSIAIGGRWIIIGFLGGEETTVNLKDILKKRISIIGSNLRGRPLEEKIDLVSDFKSKYLDRFKSGELLPMVDRIFEWQEVNQAHEYIENNLNIGKVILEIH